MTEPPRHGIYEKRNYIIGIITVFLAVVGIYVEVWGSSVEKWVNKRLYPAKETEITQPGRETEIPINPVAVQTTHAYFTANAFPDFAHSLNSLIAGGYTIETVALNGRDWVIVYDRNRVQSSGNLPGSLGAALDSLRQLDAHIRQVVFTPWQGGWLVLHDRNAVASEYTSGDLLSAIRRVQQEGTELVSIAVSNMGGWVLSRGDHGRVAGGPLPDGFNAHQPEVGGALVSFTPAGGYLDVIGNHLQAERHLPARARDQLLHLLNQGERVRLAVFPTSDTWVFLTDR